MSFTKLVLILLLAASLIGCKGMQDDLRPSGEDRSGDQTTTDPTTQADLVVSDTTGASVDLLEVAAANRGLVLYFTMWCPVCNSHTDHMRSNIIPYYPEVRFYLVDYLSGTVAQAKTSQESSGYAALETLVDLDNLLEDRFNGTMGVTVVIDSAGQTQMQEDYKDGSRLAEILNGL